MTTGTADTHTTRAVDAYRETADGHARRLGVIARKLAADASSLRAQGFPDVAAELDTAGTEVIRAGAGHGALEDLAPVPAESPGPAEPAPVAAARWRLARARAEAVRVDRARRGTVAAISALRDTARDAGLDAAAERAEAVRLAVTTPRFCDSGAGVHPAIFGPPPEGRWPRGALTYSIDTTGCTFVPPSSGPPTTAEAVLDGAFAQWDAASRFFTFTKVAAGASADVRVSFGGAELYSSFGTVGGVLAHSQFPTVGTLWLDSTESWDATLLLQVALHELGHVLGLRHSSTPGGLMWWENGSSSPTTIDADSALALSLIYDWSPQAQLGDRATSGRAALGLTSWVTFVSRVDTARMVWKGVGDDTRVWQANAVGAGWSGQQVVPGVATSDSPVLTSIGVPGHPNQSGLLLAGRGAEPTRTLWWTRDLGAGWEPRRDLGDRSSATTPALGSAGGRVFMAWRGSSGDESLWWSAYDEAGSWSAQRHVVGVDGVIPGSADSPTMAMLGNRIYLFWRGAGSDTTMWFASRDPAAPDDAPWTAQTRITYALINSDGTQTFTPAGATGPRAVWRDGLILLAWRGTGDDSSLYVSAFDGSFGGQVHLGDRGSLTGPSLVALVDRLLMAWKGAGSDGTIWWSQI